MLRRIYCASLPPAICGGAVVGAPTFCHAMGLPDKDIPLPLNVIAITLVGFWGALAGGMVGAVYPIAIPVAGYTYWATRMKD